MSTKKKSNQVSEIISITRKTLTFAIIINILIIIVDCDRMNDSSSLQTTVARDGFLLYNRWYRGKQEVINDNEIGENNRDSFIYKSQQDYVCGRAIANKKLRDALLKDTNYQMSNGRAKYRPIEIRMPRIIGGDDTSPGEFPWAVSIKLNGQPICGGSLIDKNWILTAAHCVVGYNPKNLTIRLGAFRIKDLSETQTIDLPISMFIVHKDYSMPRPFSNDIAMIKLIQSVDFTDFIIPICLPTEDQLTTSTSSTSTLNDYSHHGHETSAHKHGANNAEFDEDTGGIVVSTKMSDDEISKCFSRLDQNYLNSIGLGPIVEPTVTSTTEQPHRAQMTAQAATTLFSAYGNPLHPLFMNNANNNNRDQASKFLFLQTQNNNHNNKVAGGLYSHPTYDDVSQASKIHTSGSSDDNLHYNTQSWHNGQLNHAAGLSDSERGRIIKLSRLPISKELLREIQSIGSAQMTSLNLDSQPVGEFDLNQDNVVNEHQQSPFDSISTSSSDSSNNNKNGFKNQPHYNIVRTVYNDDNDNDNEILDMDDSNRYSGLSGTVVGWGWIRELDGEDQVNNKGYTSVTLQKVKLPILRNHICEAWFQSQSKKITLLPSQFCAGFNSGGKDACRGDSGGPMIIEDSSDTGRYKLIGIVSAGIGCARPSLPGLYTRVASFLPWINAQMSRY